VLTNQWEFSLGGIPAATFVPARVTYWTAPHGGEQVHPDADGYIDLPAPTVLYADFGHPHARPLAVVTPPRDTT
jgi:hypothetical protein